MFIGTRPNASGAAVVAVDVRQRMPSPTSQCRQRHWRPMISVNGSCDGEGTTFHRATSTTRWWPAARASLSTTSGLGSRPSPDYVLESGSSVVGDEYLKVLSCEPHHERFTVQPTRAVTGWLTGLFPRPFRWPPLRAGLDTQTPGPARHRHRRDFGTGIVSRSTSSRTGNLSVRATGA